MVVKRYLVKDMNEAMIKIKNELGKDAIIISQRRVRAQGIKGYFSPKLMEVTAAIENNKEDTKSDAIKESIVNIKRIMNEEQAKKEQAIKIPQIVKVEQDSKLREEVLEMKEMLNKVLMNTTESNSEKENLVVNDLKELDIDESYIKEISTYLENSENKTESLKEFLMKDITVDTKEISGRVVLIGPTGVGKTTTIAKLAGKLALIDKKKVGLITIDTYRIGAVEQLKTYADIMNLPFKVVITTKEMEEAIEDMKDLDVILIDTTGRSSKNTMQISELRAFVTKAKPDDVMMVLSSTTKNKDIKVILDGYGDIGFNRIVMTKLDETSNYGAIYTTVRESGKPIGYITVGQDVPHDIKAVTKEMLANLISGEDVSW